MHLRGERGVTAYCGHIVGPMLGGGNVGATRGPRTSGAWWGNQVLKMKALVHQSLGGVLRRRGEPGAIHDMRAKGQAREA